MAAPNIQDAGSVISGQGSVSISWPTHAADDIGILVIETGGEGTTLTPSGWTHVTGSPLTDVASTSGSKLHVLWKRATSSSEPSVSTGDSGDHQIANIFTVRGCVTTGNPWDVIASSTKTTASTTVTFPTVTTTVADALVVLIGSRPDDSSSNTAFSAVSNGNLTSLAESHESGTVSGHGGGFVVASGVKSAAGSVGSTTMTGPNVTNATFTIGFKPPTAAGVFETVGSSSGSATVTGVGAAVAASVGSSSGSATATGIGAAIGAAAGSANAVGTVTGVSGAIVGTVGTASGSSSVVGAGDDASVAPSEPDGIGYLGGMPTKRRKDYDFLNPKPKPKPQEQRKEVVAERQNKDGRPADGNYPLSQSPNNHPSQDNLDIAALSRAIDTLRAAEMERMRTAIITDAVQTGLIGLAVDMERLAKEAEEVEEREVLEMLFNI